jgi:DNA helicase-2/ATP-dependent DNA helicase PcrA
LAGDEGNIFVVGDPDQSIYGWRGADIRNILDFEKDYPEARTISLTYNYRSTQNILDAANELISNNLDRKEKELYTDCGSGEKIVFHLADTDKAESHYVIKSLNYLINEGYSLGDCAGLYRTHAQSRLFEEECIPKPSNTVSTGGNAFLRPVEIKKLPGLFEGGR